MRIHPIVLSGAQKQHIMAAASKAAVHYDTLRATVEDHLVRIVGHRNGRPRNIQLHAAIKAALAEL